MQHPRKRKESHQSTTAAKAGVTHSVSSECIKAKVNIVLDTECFPREGSCFNFLLRKYAERKYQSAHVLCNSVLQPPLGS